MEPEQLRGHLLTLQQTIASLLDGWTLVACCTLQRSRDAVAWLLPFVRYSVSDTAQLLAQPLPSDGRLLVLCDDEHSDGGAVELIDQMRRRHGAERCRFLLCLDAAISDARLLQLWSLRPDGLGCREHYGDGRLLQSVAVVLRNGRYEDPELSDRLHRLLSAPCSAAGLAVTLTAREEALLHLLARGRSTAEVAALHGVRVDTVRRKLSGLYRKTGTRNRGGLLVWGLEHGLIRRRDLSARLRSATAGTESAAGRPANRKPSSPAIPQPC